MKDTIYDHYIAIDWSIEIPPSIELLHSRDKSLMYAIPLTSQG